MSRADTPWRHRLDCIVAYGRWCRVINRLNEIYKTSIRNIVILLNRSSRVRLDRVSFNMLKMGGGLRTLGPSVLLEAPIFGVSNLSTVGASHRLPTSSTCRLPFPQGNVSRTRT